MMTVLLRNVPLIRYPRSNGATQRHFINIFQFTAEGDSPRNGADLYAEILEFFIKVKDRGIPFHRGTQRYDYFFYTAGCHTCYQTVDLQVRWPDTVHRRNKPTKHMIHALVLIRILDCHHITHIFQHAYESLIPLMCSTDFTNNRIRNIVARRTVPDFLFQPIECPGKPRHLSFGLLQQMEHQPQGRLLAYTRQSAKLRHR